MRRFLLIAHDARSTADFSLDDLPGSGGRMDLVARCAVAALLVSHGVRTDTEFLAAMLGPPRPPRLVRFVGSEIRSLNPDERSTAALLRKALEEEALAERSPHRGIYVGGRGLRGALAAAVSKPVILLDEAGEDIRSAAFGGDVSFVLSDHKDLTEEERGLVRGMGAVVVRVGPRRLQADQVITIVHNELDRRG